MFRERAGDEMHAYHVYKLSFLELPFLERDNEFPFGCHLLMDILSREDIFPIVPMYTFSLCIHCVS